MSEVRAWHSVIPKEIFGTDVYHTHLDCSMSRRIRAENIREGTGSRQLCKECAHRMTLDSGDEHAEPVPQTP